MKHAFNAPSIGLTGHFKMTVGGGKRGRVVLAEFDNLILDAGLNRLGTGEIASHIQVGSGSSTPTVSQTALDAFVAQTSTVLTGDVDTYVAGPPEYINIIRGRRFAEGVAAGNLSEVGIGWTAAPGSLFSRALILDGLGSPTTITVLSDEFLDVEYTLRVYPPALDRTGMITIQGVNYNYTIRACNTSSSSQSGALSGWTNARIMGGIFGAGEIGAVYAGAINASTTGAPSGASASTGVFPISAAYANNSYQNVFSYNLGLTNANLAGGGFRSLTVACGRSVGRFQIDFGALVPKDATRVFTASFRVAWARRP